MKTNLHFEKHSVQPVHVYGQGESYYYDMEELVRLLVGRPYPRIDDSGIIDASNENRTFPSSYYNKNEFIMDSF